MIINLKNRFILFFKQLLYKAFYEKKIHLLTVKKNVLIKKRKFKIRVKEKNGPKLYTSSSVGVINLCNFNS